MGAHSSRALITSSEALQLNVDPLSPAFLANTEMRRLILAGGRPTAAQKRALGWLLYNRRERGADPATSRLLRVSGLKARPPPQKITWEGEQLDAIEAALRMECWPNPPPRGIKWGKVERRGLQRILAIPWKAYGGGALRRVDPAQLKLEVLAAAALGFLGGEEGDVKALARFELTTRKASKALFVGSRLVMLREQFQEQGSGRIGTIKFWSRGAEKFVCLFDDGSEKNLGVSALFGNIVKSRSLEGGVVLCRKTEVDVLNWYKREVRWRGPPKPPPNKTFPTTLVAVLKDTDDKSPIAWSAAAHGIVIQDKPMLRGFLRDRGYQKDVEAFMDRLFKYGFKSTWVPDVGQAYVNTDVVSVDAIAGMVEETTKRKAKGTGPATAPKRTRDDAS